MNYILGVLIGVAIVFSCISLVFIRRAMRALKALIELEKRRTNYGLYCRNIDRSSNSI